MTTFRSVPPPPSPSPQPHRAALDAGAGALANDDSAREWPVAAALDDEPEYWWLVIDADGNSAIDSGTLFNPRSLRGENFSNENGRRRVKGG